MIHRVSQSYKGNGHQYEKDLTNFKKALELAIGIAKKVLDHDNYYDVDNDDCFTEDDYLDIVHHLTWLDDSLQKAIDVSLELVNKLNEEALEWLMLNKCKMSIHLLNLKITDKIIVDRSRSNDPQDEDYSVYYIYPESVSPMADQIWDLIDNCEGLIEDAKELELKHNQIT